MSDGCSDVGLVLPGSLAISLYNSIDTPQDVTDTPVVQVDRRQG
jgi:hypothetical protein